MEADTIIAILKQTLGMGAMVMSPIILSGLAIGISVGVLQSATQVNEPTLTFVPKVIGVGLTGGLLLPWILDHFVLIFHFVIDKISLVTVH